MQNFSRLFIQLLVCALFIALAVPIASAHTVTFSVAGSGTLSDASGTGQTTITQTVPSGNAALVLAVADPGFHFTGWIGSLTSASNPLTVKNVTSDMAITATFAANVPGTMTYPDYSQPVLAPSSQSATAWTNVIPNALASYFTYVPYSNADAVALGFPASCGNPSTGLEADLSSIEDCYTITVKSFNQQLAMPGSVGGGLINPATGNPFGAATRVFAYGSGGTNWTPPGASTAVTGNAPLQFAATGIWNFPGPTVKASKGRPVRIQWLNELPNEAPVGFDPSVECGTNAPYCFPYNRIVTHVHGAHVKDDSDGYPGAWFTPGFSVVGPGWAASIYGPEGTYRYPMDQDAATLWYHDHAVGATHNNVQMGLAGFFPVTDANEQNLIANNILPTGDYELGFALQDRVFDMNGQFAMPDYPIHDLLTPGCVTDPETGLGNPFDCTRIDWMKDPADGHLVPYDPGNTEFLSNPINADAPFPAASTTLEYFGNMPVVNGVAYGKYDVEPRVYRMRFIGGTDSRTWIMQLMRRDNNQVIPFWQIGSEQGFLPNPVSRQSIDLMPGERVDVLVDLTGIPADTKIVMKNLGPDYPYEGLFGVAVPSVDIPEIMEFTVVTLTGTDTIVTPSVATNLRPVSGAITSLSPTTSTPRVISLEEIVDGYGRTMPTIDMRGFMGAPATELVRLNDIEEWDIVNNTVDAHPIHLHLVAFQVVHRQKFDPATFVQASIVAPYTQAEYVPDPGDSTIYGPELWEQGWKDTIDAPPGMVTRVKAKFDIAGDRYVYHCHILSHEEHDMMRPLVVFEDGACGSANGGAFVVQPSENLCAAGTASAVTPTTTGWTWICNGLYEGSSASPTCSATRAFTVTTNATNGAITSPLNPEVRYGFSTTVTGTANPGYYFTGVNGCGGSPQTNTNQNVTTFSYTTGAITGPCTVSATFAIKNYTVTTTATHGTITSPLNPKVNHGSTTTVTGTASTGYYFAGVSGCEGTPQTNTNQAITTFSYTTGQITEACTVTATFAIKTYTVTTNATNGTITSPVNPQVNHGSTTTVTGSANDGYYFTGLSGCGLGQTNTNQNVTTFSYTTWPITGPCTVSASFAIRSYTVTTTASHGAITSTLNPVVNHGGTTTVTGTANPNYYFLGVDGCNGTPQTNADQGITSFSYSTGSVTGACTVSAVFAPTTRTFTITLAGTGGGTITPSFTGGNCGTISWNNSTGTIVCDYGTQLVLSATPDTESDPAVASWSGACTTTTSCSVTMTSDQSATITFNSQAGFSWYQLPGLRIGFVDTSMNTPVTARTWDFGDATSGAEQNPVHQYPSAATYLVTLTTTGAGITPSVTLPVQVVDACALGIAHVAGSASYGALMDLYTSAGSEAVIEIQAAIAAADPIFSGPGKTVTVKGGFDCNYLANRWSSSMTGTVTLAFGTVIMNNIVIQ